MVIVDLSWSDERHGWLKCMSHFSEVHRVHHALVHAAVDVHQHAERPSCTQLQLLWTPVVLEWGRRYCFHGADLVETDLWPLLSGTLWQLQ